MNKWARRQEKVKMTFKTSVDSSSSQKNLSKNLDDCLTNAESVKVIANIYNSNLF